MRIVRLLGTEWRVHLLWLPLVAISVAAGQWQDMLVVFSLVFLHEISHCVVAGMLGLRVVSITLTPVGGTARIDGLMEAGPSTEWMIAAAGPLCNAILAVMAVFLERYHIITIPAFELDRFVAWNGWLIFVNLLPALPLDGGRMARALLSKICGFQNATEACAAIALGFATVALGWFGMEAWRGQWQWNLAVFAIFLFISARQEKKAAPYSFLRELTTRKDALKDKGSLPIGQLAVRYNVCLKDCLRRFKPSRYYVVMVLNAQGKIAGTLTESEIVEAIIRLGPLATVGEAL